MKNFRKKHFEKKNIYLTFRKKSKIFEKNIYFNISKKKFENKNFCSNKKTFE